MGSADELRLALRRLLKRPAATLAAVVTLAVSIGAATATWSLLSAVLLHPLPVAGADRLMVVGTQVTQGRDAGTLRMTHLYPYYPHIRDSGVFESVAAQWLSPPQLLVSTGGVPVQTSVGFATHNFFDVLGVRIPVGRNFTGEDDRRGAAPVAILTERYWRRVFEASNAVIGRTIMMAGKPVTIVGVAAPGFRGLDLAQAPDLYLPFHTVADVTSPLTNYFAEPNHGTSPTSGTMVVGRLRAGDRAETAASRLTTLGPLPDLGSPPHYGLTNVNAAAVPQAARAGMSRFGRLLGTTVGLLLLIGCGTVGLLLLIRTEARREEFAMCLALGASRTRLARGVTLEGGMLAASGALLALPISGWLFNGARAFQLPGGVSIGLLELAIDRRALVVAIACAALTTLGIALIAVTLGFASDLTQELHGRAGATPRLTRRPTRTALVAAQVAVAVALLAGTGLFVRSLQTALGLNSGLDVERLVIGQLFLGQYGYDASQTATFFEDVAGRLRGNPAIRSMAFSASQGGMGPDGKLVIDGEPRQFPSMVRFEAIDEYYFGTMGIPILAGRAFSADDRANAPLVTIVSASFGRQLAGGGSPIGRRITMPFRVKDQPADVREVIGVVGDVVTTVSVLEPLAMYMPLARTAAPNTITARAMSDADAVRREMLSAIRQINSAITPPPMLTMEERITRQMAAQEFGALVMGSLGFIAILLTLLGTYVVAESLSVMRTRELGIRAALGARGTQLAGIVLAETGRLVGIGLIFGLAIVWAGASTIRAFLFGVQPLDPATLATVGASILVLAMVVSTRPALRAARVDLGKVLRAE